MVPTAEQWRTSWEFGIDRFHEARPHRLIVPWASGLRRATGHGRVLVPLCGKSESMSYLASNGHDVLGVEASALAVTTFFRDHALSPAQHPCGGFTSYRAANLEILCGDFFELDPDSVGPLYGAYDRAAFVAVHPHRRGDYAKKLARLLRPGASLLLIGLLPSEAIPPGPPYALSGEGIGDLFAPAFEVWHLATFKNRHRAPDGQWREYHEPAFHLRRRAR